MVQDAKRRLVNGMGNDKRKLLKWLEQTALPVVIGILFLCCYGLVFSSFLEEASPEPNVDGKYYRPSGEVYAQFPITLEDVGLETLPYRYTSSFRGDNLISDRGTYVDSMVEQLEQPEQVWTLSYEIWRNPVKGMLDRKEAQLQKRYGEQLAEAQYDYGAEQAYWIGEQLLLRYEDVIVLFNAETTRELVDSSVCADFMRESFTVQGYLYDAS